jgi:hypothetical protein
MWGGHIIVPADTPDNVGTSIARIEINIHSEAYGINAQADAERIVACVNACQGIPTEDLQGNTVFYLVSQGFKQEIESEKALADRLGNSIARLLERIHKLNPMSSGCIVEAEELLIELDNRRSK